MIRAQRALRVATFVAAASVAEPVAAQRPPSEAQATQERHGAPLTPRITLDEVWRLARARSPRLVAARAMAEASATREPAAGLLPDPVLQIGFMNLSLPSLSANMPASMAPSFLAMQMLPFPGKLSLMGRMAAQETAMMRAGAEETWWEVRSDVARVFYELFETDQRLEVMSSTVGLLQQFETIAKTMYAAGTGRQSDVLRASVEVARMEAEITRMHAMRTAAAAMLNAQLARPGDTPVPTPALPELPADVPDRATLIRWADETRPALTREQVGWERAGTELSLSRKELWPDLTLGFEYGQRPSDMGSERMGSAMVSFSLPMFANRRQLKQREQAAAMERAALAELDQMRAMVDARISELLAERERTATLIRLYHADVLPQAKANVESSLSSYRVGAVDFMTLVDAQMTVNEYQGELFELIAEYGASIAALEHAVGRTLSSSIPLVVEGT